MVLGVALILVGVALMGFGVCMLLGWITGRSGWFDQAVYDRPGNSKTDRLSLDVYYIVRVIAPLLVGATLIAFGLKQCLG